MPATDILGIDDAAHLLRRAGFGARERDVERLAGERRVDAVQSLLLTRSARNRPPASRRNDGDGLDSMQRWWLKRMLKRKWRLHEKLVLFWHDHFACSFDVVEDLRQLAFQNRVFRQYGMGSFRELLWHVTRDPAMLEFLDGRRNRRGRPNENYARELMELFCLGVVDRNGVENYTQTDVEELARALTGYRIEKDAGELRQGRFDAGDKVLFAGTTYEMSGNLGVETPEGELFPPQQNVLDAMFDHVDSDGRPTLARFVARKMWEWFAFPDPPTALVDELADVFRGSGYVVRSLVGAILVHDAFYSAEARISTAKTPVEFVLQTLQTFGAKSKFTDTPDELRAMGMDLFNPPGVNGWNHGPGWLSAGRYLARLEFAQAVCAGRSSRVYKLKPKKLLPKRPESNAEIVDALIAPLYTPLPPEVRTELIAYLDGGAALDEQTRLEVKYRGALLLLASLPEFQVH